MSKKSRRRNRRILGALAALGTGLALANRGKGTEMSNVSVDSGRGSGLRPTVDDVEFKESIVSTPVRTKTTVMDSMPKRPKYNEKSIRVKDGKVFTIEDAKKGIKPKRSGIDTPGIYVRDDGRITAGGKQYLNKQHYASRNEKPAMLGTEPYTAPRVLPKRSLGATDMEQYIMDNPLSISAKKGGRIVKGKKTAVRTGAAKRGFGRAFKGGKR